MYKRVLLAYDGSIEGRSALREGALLAKHCEARVFLLSIVAETAGVRLAESVYAGVIAKEGEVYQGILDEGAERLKQLGLSAVAALEFGEPAPTIAGFARRVEADLVVVGHRHRGALERWWTGSTSAHLLDLVECSLLIAKDTSADEGLQAKTPVGRS
ncbi:MAG: universal stress protein [Phenylobacterium sp.]|uniref:universal stress protein n=1 Tax=Phenylobacterium sp. TaxID=1871053 RepID=UPI0012103D82|nr:universal stress protein [Phenylobacterium sp.]TAJ71522.1 MAG: universal stress protein [Phenylobacterium sp.]